jgi:hypothetical protein
MAIALTPKTTIGTLLSEYPFLLQYLADYHPEFKRLTNPVTRRTVARLATLERVAGMAGVPTQKLLADVAAEIAARTGVPPEVGATAAAGVDPARQEELKAIIRELHDGRTPDEVRPRFAALIQDIDAAEIAAMEQALIAEGMPDTEVKRLCDVHVKVFEEALDTHPQLDVPAGHPIETFQRENRALLEITQALRDAAGCIDQTTQAADWKRGKASLTGSAERLVEVDLHYLRKENQLFPFLEKHGVEGPSKVMWALHDDIRAVIKDLREKLAEDDVRAALHAVDEVTTMVDDMVTKEQKILFPMAVEMLSEEEWRPAVAAEAVPAPSPAPTVTPAGPPAVGEPLALHTGSLSIEQINLMLGVLPIDFSFVDENDEVRFYSEGERNFPRSPGVIGRKVQNCHPPASVHKVQEIIDAFRTGEKSAADFWITLGGKFLHIRYFAVRDAEGNYRGVVETVQDVTGIRALEGQRRLLEW